MRAALTGRTAFVACMAAITLAPALLDGGTARAAPALRAGAQAAPAATTTTVAAAPNPVLPGGTVTLTATVRLAGTGAGVPAGTVQFEINGTAIGPPASLNANGQASITVTFIAAGTQLVTAIYQPPSNMYATSTSAAFTETITSNPNPGQEGELVTTTVPPSGTFTFGPSGNGATPSVPLTMSGLTATGSLGPVVVTDTRTGLTPESGDPALVNGYSGYPGWSVVGQVGNFSAPGSHPAGQLSGNQLGWTPTTASQGDFTLGTVVVPASAGLGSSPRVLASAGLGHGFGPATLGANLILAIPPTAPAGQYTAILTLTANPLANFT